MFVTGRDYISFSQMACWEGSVRQWENRYIHKKPFFETDALLLGKEFAEALEGKPASPEATETAQAFKLIYGDELGVAEVEWTAYYEIDGKKYKLYGKIDDLDTDQINEVKTGSKKWTQLRAEAHGQVLLYQLMVFLETGKKLKGKYFWLPTENNHFTGEIKTFDINYDEEKIEGIKRRVERYINFLNNYKPIRKL